MMSSVRSSRVRVPFSEANTNYVCENRLSSRRSEWLHSALFSRNYSRTKNIDISKLRVDIVIPQDVSLSFALSQVCGGPLQGFTMVQEAPVRVLALFFMNELHADSFRSYLKTNHCIVGGYLIHEFKGNNTDSDPSCSLAPPIPISSQTQARRVLEIIHPIKLTSSCSLIKCEVSPEFIMKRFRKMGKVIQVRPMFYQKNIAYSIEFDTVHAANMAKNRFDNEKLALFHRSKLNGGLFFADLYDWRVQYSSDILETGCFI